MEARLGLILGDAQRFGGGALGGAFRLQLPAQGGQHGQVILDALKSCQHRLPIGGDALVVTGDGLRFLGAQRAAVEQGCR